MRWRTLLHHRTIRTFVRGGMNYFFGRRGQRRVWGLRLFYRMRVEVLLLTDAPVAKLARRTEVRLWVDGHDAFDRIERCLRQARVSVVVQMFLWKDDETGRRMAQWLIDAADRGVRVDVAKDSVGDVFEGRRDFIGTQHSHAPVWQRFWHHPNIAVHYETHHDHAKVFAIDDQILLLSGMNVSDDYLQWHDYLVELRGSHFVRQYLTRDAGISDDHSVALVINTEDKKAIRPVFMSLLGCAEQSIIFEHSYLVDPDVIDALIVASKRRVRVVVILPDRANWYHHANMQSVGRLLTEGNPLFLQVLVHPTMVHAKTILIDRRIAFLGSANSIKSSLDELGEVNVLIEGKHRTAIRKLRASLREDILRSRSLQSPPAVGWFTKWLAALGL